MRIRSLVHISLALCCAGCTPTVKTAPAPGAVDVIPESYAEYEPISKDGNRTRYRLVKKKRPEIQRAALRPLYLDRLTSESTEREDGPQLIFPGGYPRGQGRVRIAPDGSWFATVGIVQSTVQIWRSADGAHLRTLRAHNVNITGLEISPDGRHLVTISGDRTIKIWRVADGSLAHEISIERYAKEGIVVTMALDLIGRAKDISFHPDGRLAAAMDDGTVRIIDLATGEDLEVLHEERKFWKFYDVDFSSDGQRLAARRCRDQRCEFVIWNTDSWKKVWSKTAVPYLGSIELSADGRWLAHRGAGSDESLCWVRVWDTRGDTNKVLAKQRCENGLTYAFSSSQPILAITGREGIDLFQVDTWKKRGRINAKASRYTIAFSSDGNSIYQIQNGRIDQVRLSDQQQLDSIDYETTVDATAALAFDPSQRFLVTLSRPADLLTVRRSNDLVRFWDLDLGGVRRTAPPRDSKSSSDRIEAWALSRDGQQVATAKKGGKVTIWNTANGASTNVAVNQAGLYSLALAPDSAWGASGDEKVIKLWRPDGSDIRTFANIGATVTSLAFSPDGRHLVSVSLDDAVRVWTVPDAKLVSTMWHNEWPWSATMSPDKKWVASSQKLFDGRQFKLWDVAKSKLQRVLIEWGSDFDAAFAFSPDNKYLAFTRADGGIGIWRIGRTTIQTLAGHTEKVFCLTYTPDGRYLVSGSWDGTTRLWNAKSGELVATLASFGADWVVVAPNGLFDGSPNGWRRLGWRFGAGDVASVESFFNEYFHPGLLSDLLGGRALPVPQKLADIDRRQPTVELSAPEQANDRKVKVTIEVEEAPADAEHPTGSGAQDVRLLHNGSLVKIWRGDALAGSANATLTVAVPVVAGKNRFTAYAFSAANIKSRDASLMVVGSEKLRRPRTLHILAVGVNEYRNSAFNLTFATPDARSFASVVAEKQRGLGRFERIEQTLLLDQDATRGNILAALRRLSGARGASTPAVKAVRKAEPEDAVMIYFAGHGTTKGDRFFMLPHDISYKGALDAVDDAGLTQLTRSGISDRDLEKVLEPLHASDLYLVIDACNSGQALEARDNRRGPMNSRGLAQLAYDKGINILTASQGYQLANEATSLGHGFLTFALVEEGLKTAKADLAPADGFVTGREWLQHAIASVPALHEQILASDTRGIRKKTKRAQKEGDLQWVLQKPRAFFRREASAEGIVLAQPSKGSR